MSLVNIIKKKANGIVFTIASLFSIISFSLPFFTREKTESINTVLSVSLSAVSTILTAATFIVAYFLYEKLSLDRRIMDKQADTVLQLIDFLKGKTFYAKSKGYIYMIRPSIDQLNQFVTSPNYATDSKKVILINSNDYDIFFQSLTPLIRSYWMPAEIKEKLLFLEFGLYNELSDTTTSELASNYIVFNFSHRSEDVNCIVMFPETTLASFILNLQSLVQAVEQWLSDRSSIPVELRLWEPI